MNNLQSLLEVWNHESKTHFELHINKPYSYSVAGIEYSKSGLVTITLDDVHILCCQISDGRLTECIKLPVTVCESWQVNTNLAERLLVIQEALELARFLFNHQQS